MKDMLNEPSEKILGVGYDYETDEMAVRIGEKHKREVWTKQEVLSFISSIYDPTGLVAPWIWLGKLIFQEINRLGLGWKDVVPPELLARFLKWKESIVHLKVLRVPRWTNPLGLENYLCDLVIFSDASNLGYGIVGYVIKYLPGGGVRSVSLLIGKCHVVPTGMSKNKTKDGIDHDDSIPRLELCAAKLAAQWRDILLRQSGEKFNNIYLFSDSLTVLSWLTDYDKRFKTFVNFRVKYIRKNSNVETEWRYVPTNLNPADLCSRGIEANDFKKWAFYYNGPPFLLLPPSEWPPKTENAPKKREETSSEVDLMEGRLVKSPTDAAYAMATFSPLELLAADATLMEPKLEIAAQEFQPWPLRVAAKHEEWRKKVRMIAIVR